MNGRLTDSREAEGGQASEKKSNSEQRVLHIWGGESSRGCGRPKRGESLTKRFALGIA